MCIGRLGANICPSFRKLSFITICREEPSRLLFLFLRVERPFCYILIQSRRAVGGGRSLSSFSPANGFIIAVTPLPETGPEEKSRETVLIGLKHELVSLESLLLLCGLQVRFSERDKATLRLFFLTPKVPT